MADSRRRLLIVSYWYPPAVGAAAERVASFARYLPVFGWDVFVVCAGDPAAAADSIVPHAKRIEESGDTSDEGGAADQPAPVVLRIGDPRAGAGPVFADYDPRRARDPLWKRLARHVVFPDRFVRWRRRALRRMTAEWGATRFDAVLASFPPASVVELGMAAATQWNAPLVLDVRDLWLGPGGYAPPAARLQRRHAALERAALPHAAAVTTVSEHMARALATAHRLNPDRVVAVPNGYEAVGDGVSALAQVNADSQRATSDIARAGPEARGLLIAHVGTVIQRNRPDLFLAALAAQRTDARLAGVSFEFVGNLSRNYVASLGLSDCVRTTGLVPVEAARRAMREADGLLLLVGAYVGRWGHNAKVFEYVQSGRPILCVEESPGSSDGLLLKRFVGERTFFAMLDDPASIAAAVDAMRAYVANRPEAAMALSAEFRAYSRERLAARLAEVLAEVSGPGS